MSSANITTRYRSVPYRKSFYSATVWTILHLFSLGATITCVGFFFVHHKSINVFQFRRIIIACVVFCFISFIISFYKRRAARCPLCIGTPLINTGALTHKRSRVLGPLNEGFTAVLSIAFTQKFRCMYCGTRYDLLKTPHRKQRNGED